jgi:hemerythrin superfamily protein
MHQNQNSRNTSANNVIGFLKEQHEKIKELFEQVFASHGADREKLFTQLKTLMTVHEAAEERIVHPEAKSAIAGGTSEVAAREMEEAKAKSTLTALSKLDLASSEFETMLMTLQKAVLAHARSEEDQEFDKLGEKLDPRKLVEMRKQVEAVERTSATSGNAR